MSFISFAILMRIVLTLCLCSCITLAVNTEETTIIVSDIMKTDYGTIEQVSDHSGQGGDDRVDFLWKVPDFWQLVNTEQEIVMSTRFYTTEPGYRLQLMLIPNTTYSDSQGYLGTFIRLVTGIYDSMVEWPYKMKTQITVVGNGDDNSMDKDSTGSYDMMMTSDGKPHTIVPNTDACRLRSAFLRPSADQDFNPNPDGCGNRRHIALNVLADNEDRYLVNDTLTIRLSIHLHDYGQAHRVAQMSMRYNQIVSYYEWTIDDYMRAQNRSLEDQKIAVLTSEPFYTHSKGYLMQIFMTLMPKRKAFAISLAMSQGDYDRHLQWPFPYKFELSLVDHSPNYWRRDYTVSMHPSTSECGTDPFQQPSNYPDFCFITIQSMELLSLTHYNFIVNNSLTISFVTKFSAYSMRKQASLVMSDGSLVSEYNWLIPGVSGKLDKYDLVKNKPKTLASEEFYTNGQGYLCQILLSVNRTANNDYAIGLQMALIEGEYDAVVDWPFNNTYQLSIVRQNRELFDDRNDTISNEFKYVINPWSGDCERKSFQRPIERNIPCGPTHVIPFSRISRSQELLNSDNLLVRIRIQNN